MLALQAKPIAGKNKLMSKLEWFVVMTKPGRQDDVTIRLKNANYAAFNPKLNQYSKKRSQYIVQPLFPLYIFVKLDIEKDFKLIKYTRGVLRILGVGKVPYPISEIIVTELMKRCSEGELITAKFSLDDDIQKGDKVQIMNGPLEGIEAVVSGVCNNRQRVEILLDLMKISMNKENIKKL
jgi:transcription antitermination factor NusG